MTAATSRTGRLRRGGRRPGWMLLTALLILAIAASSVLVFTSRVELLKLAVVVSLWAAVAAAFASVGYRRQSEADQARARDLKLVYDLQLDREISARREYELAVESQLRRELSVELRDRAGNEVAALRAELAALRSNLELLFEADLSTRRALEAERTAVHTFSDWDRDGADRFATRARPEDAEDTAGPTVEYPIIDVSEVGIPADADASIGARQPVGGRRSRRHRTRPQPGLATRAESAPEAAGVSGVSGPAETGAPAADWQPVAADGEWLPPGTPGSNWVTESAAGRPAAATGRRHRSRHGRPDGAGAPPGIAVTPGSRAGHHQQERSTGLVAGAESAADLLARLHAEPGTGGRRRRRRAE